MINFDLKLFSKKLNNLINDYEFTLDELYNKCRINRDRLNGFINARVMPLGDEVLILSDVFSIDYYYFLSNETKSPIDKTQKFFRANGNILTKNDKRSIAETLYAAEFAITIQRKNGFIPQIFTPKTTARNHVAQGKIVAYQLREQLEIKLTETEINPFKVVRDLGIQIFRRKLTNSKISGIHMENPNTGKIILINHFDDVYRQNFSVLHELAHSIFDSNSEYQISMDDDISNSQKKEAEWRANSFASNFLIPCDLALALKDKWKGDEEYIELANRLTVNPITLAFSLKKNGVISKEDCNYLSKLKIPKEKKIDPELKGLSTNGMKRIKELHSHGISFYFLKLSYEAYLKDIISFSKLSEVLMINEKEIEKLIIDMGWVI
jgi:Zn-dependent peptidase ImmA (M78 family)